MWLFSTYQVSLPRPALIRSEAGAPVTLLVNLKGWDAEVKLSPDTRLGRIRLPGVGGWHYPVSRLEISVARDGELGDEMVHEEAARAMLGRLLGFLQLRTQYSLFEAIERYQQFHSDSGAAPAGAHHAVLELVTGYEQQNLRDYLCELFSQALCRGLLHDAAESIAHGRSRRACLELTMACESALGMRLESGALVRAGMGSVFVNQLGRESEEIVRLFQTRDAMKQPGDGLFKFISGARRQALERDLTHWQGAVECLINWLNAMNKGLQEAR